MTISAISVSPKNELNDLVKTALASKDGQAITEYINSIACLPGDPHLRSSALIEIAKRHEFASHIVVGVLSNLALHNLPNAREFARSLILARLDRDKDLIVARAHALLIELPPVDPIDVPTIVKGFTHPFDTVRETISRSLTFLPVQSANVFRDELQKLPQTRATLALNSKLDSALIYKSGRLPSVAMIDEFDMCDDRPPREKVSKPKPVTTKKVPSIHKEQPEKPSSRARAADSAPRPTSSAETLGSKTPPPEPPRATTHVALEQPPLPTTSEYKTLSVQVLNNLCESVPDAHSFIHALGELINRCGPTQGLAHSTRFVFFACQPGYPRELFELVSGRIFQG